MGIQQTIINFIQELLYFDIWEGFIFLMLFLIDNKKKFTIKKIVFHIFMLGVLDYIICNLTPSPLLRLTILIVGLGAYMATISKEKIFKGIIINAKNIAIFLVIEASIDKVYNSFIHIELLGLQNDFQKFIYMIPIRIVEIIFIYIYYKTKVKGGEIHYEKGSKSYI